MMARFAATALAVLVCAVLASSVPLSMDSAMGVGHNQFYVDDCDDTVNGIGIDWVGNDTYIHESEYKCTQPSLRVKPGYYFAKEYCKTAKMGYHVCLKEKISYDEDVPIGGPHRPVWVTYGEYYYMPPQRWIHAMEHGAAVFLYDPCADKDEIEYFKFHAKKCLRRHIITPYKHLPKDELFSIATYGCRLKLNRVYGYEEEIASYLRRHAIKDGPEFHIVEDGNYTFALTHKAEIVTDLKDSKICPLLA